MRVVTPLAGAAPLLRAAATKHARHAAIISAGLRWPHRMFPGAGLLLDEFSAAALLTGTAIGGGFLALPHATAPAGCVPSSIILLACWLFLLLEALIVADLVVDDALNQSLPNVTTASMATLGRSAFGEVGGQAVSATFLVLMLATLVSQISKGAELISSAIRLPLFALCGLISASAAAFERLCPARLLGGVNAALTVGFVASTCCLFGEGVRVADYSRLARTDWSMCWMSLPTLLQLHVYCEVVPSICRMLGHERRRIRRAIVAGSVALLALQLSWSTLGIAVSDFGGALRTDPVEILLSGGRGVALAAATRSTAATAIVTTILGTCVALNTFVADALRPSRTSTRSSGMSARQDVAANGTRRGNGRLAAIFYAACVLTPAAIAASTTSAGAFFGAIDWAGAYPVALLWGLAPPLMALRIRMARHGTSSGVGSRARLSTALYVALAALSAAFVGSNAVTDVTAMVGGGTSRWQ